MKPSSKYHAIWQIDDKQTLVLPRNKKRTTFDTVEAATKALENQARRVSRNSRGLVRDSAGETVFTIAL